MRNVLFIPMVPTPLPSARNSANFYSILLAEWEDGGEVRAKVKADTGARKGNPQQHRIPIPPQKENMAKEEKANLRRLDLANLNSLVLAATVVSPATWLETATRDSKGRNR